MMTREKNGDSIQSHGGTKHESRDYEVLRHGNQMENKAITRMPMEGRLYQIKNDTLINKEGQCHNLVGSIIRLNEPENG
jgi:hypothetical protein